MLDLIKMRERSKSFPSELSGGAQQKVAVARAIATGSHLFLLDEPLGALDALVRAELRYELKQLAKDLRLTIIHVTHDQEEALSIADRIVIMKQGRIVETGTPAEVYLRPKSLFTENFVGETNILEAKIIGTDSGHCAIEIGSWRFSLPSSEGNVGDRVIAAIRPEFPQLRRWAKGNGLTGRIDQVAFLGSVTRYSVETDAGFPLIVHQATSSGSEEFRPGDKVTVVIDEKHMLLFSFPAQGLEKELALEASA
jgi:ABC-type Fe3+/spermidine/putrescine transport system ATPase subunit